MNLGNWKELDLLEQRRIDSNLTRSSSEDIKSTRRKGKLIAYTSILLSIISYFSIWTYSREVQSFEKLLLEQSKEYDKLILIHKKLLVDVNNVYTNNKNIAKTLISKKSATAILENIRMLIPNVIKLEGLKINDKILEIRGSAPEEEGIRNINSFILKLKKSKFFDEDSIKLKRIWIFMSAISEYPETKFIVELKYKNLNDVELEKYLKKFKAYGFANRVKYIRREGLIK
tara:strand:- start:632 stop:1321 length:690 start_codon:yes stop_codon:yes gene_type:complete